MIPYVNSGVHPYVIQVDTPLAACLDRLEAAAARHSLEPRDRKAAQAAQAAQATQAAQAAQAQQSVAEEDEGSELWADSDVVLVTDGAFPFAEPALLERLQVKNSYNTRIPLCIP